MEDPILKNSSTENQDENVNLCVDKEGLFNSATVFPLKKPLSDSKGNLKIMIEDESNKEINGYIEASCIAPTNDESPKHSESTIEKECSPTLIKSAIQVMKNLFSPEKIKRKSTGAISPSNNLKNVSIYPCFSSSVQGKADFFVSEPENITHHNIQILPGENNIRSYSQNNELDMLQIPFNLDPLDNTDESFMTTVSLIDDSFHSAVTNLDENGESLRSGANLNGCVLNDSRNSDLMDPSNNTLENNDSCLENTMLKIDNFSNENKLASFSVGNKNICIENFSNSQTEGRNSHLDDSEKGSVVQIQYGNSSIKSEKYSKNNVLGILNETNSKEEEVQNVGFQENHKKSPLTSDIIPELKNTVKSTDVADIYLNKSFAEENEQSKIFSISFDKNILKDTLEKFDIEADIDREDEIYLENSNNKGDFLGSSISATTIVLNTGESVDFENMLMSLKRDESGTNSSCLSFDSDEVICLLENEMTQSEIYHSSERNSSMLTQQKRCCISEGNSPKRSAVTKLNKSDELLNRRMFSDLKSDKSLGDFSLMKCSEASKSLRKSESAKESQHLKQYSGSENNRRSLELPSKQADQVAVVSQQSYTILTVHDKSLNRPLIEPLNISDDLSEKSFLKNKSDSMHSTESEVVGKYYGNNSSNGSFNTEDLAKTSQVKQSTPLWEGNNETDLKFFRPTTLKLYSPEIPESPYDEIKKKESFEGKKAKQIFSKNESIDEFSPVNPNDDIAVVFGNSVEGRAVINHQDHMILTSKEEIKINQSPGVKSRFKNQDPSNTAVQILNQTFDKKKQRSPRPNDQPSRDKSESRSSHPLNQTFEKKLKPTDSDSKNRSLHEHSQTPKQDKLNVTFDINSRSPSSNITFIKEVKPPEIGEANSTSNKSESPEPTLLNKTYDKPLNYQLNQTFSKSAESPAFQKLNLTFDEKSESPVPGKIIQVADEALESPIPNETNQTFVLGNNQLEKLEESNQTNDIKESDIFGAHLETVSKVENTSSKGNETYEKKTEANGICQKSLLNESQPHKISSFPPDGVLHYRSNHNIESGNNNDANDSFVSTVSSNTSLFCSDISTVVFNEEDGSANRSIDDLSGKLGKIDLNENTKQDSETYFTSNVLPEGISILKETTEEQTEGNLLSSFKDDKLPCDPDLVQLIREQFSSNDIEKICCVVQDLTSLKLSSDILKASEQFDKSFHGNYSDAECKLPDVELDKVKTINTLSPQSFDFLSSIGGKPTGRDLSRESLYVKFDPLVQPSANSLIDFTKEGEALAVNDISPVSAHSSSICEQLLTISPQKKSDAIVPPLTPISHKVKPDSNEDKLERLKELQNEIYFLKNLYAERERLNKTKMEEYENQIAKLTGESCMLEDKLKDSKEREKSLVKKLKEQTQSIGQLKIIMEEYVKVISKLSSKLETLKNENIKKLETLSFEKDSYMTHLQNTEAAFTDVHAKYEKSKKTIVSLKANETLYRNTIAEQTQKIEEFKLRAKEAQEKALMGFQKIQEELNQTKSSHLQEAARLKAQLRKTELKVEALQESLDQKIKENQQLTAICDELIEGKK